MICLLHVFRNLIFHILSLCMCFHPKYIIKWAWTCLDDGPMLVVHVFESGCGACCLDVGFRHTSPGPDFGLGIWAANTGLFVATNNMFLNTIIRTNLVDTNNQDALRSISNCHCKMTYCFIKQIYWIVIQLIFYSSQNRKGRHISGFPDRSLSD